MEKINWTHRVRVKYYVESRTLGIFYIKKRGRLNGIVTSDVETTY